MLCGYSCIINAFSLAFVKKGSKIRNQMRVAVIVKNYGGKKFILEIFWPPACSPEKRIAYRDLFPNTKMILQKCSVYVHVS